MTTQNVIRRKIRWARDAWLLRKGAHLYSRAIAMLMFGAADHLDTGSLSGKKLADCALENADKLAKKHNPKAVLPSMLRLRHIASKDDGFLFLVGSREKDGSIQLFDGLEANGEEWEFDGEYMHKGSLSSGEIVSTFCSPTRTVAWIGQGYPLHVPEGVEILTDQPSLDDYCEVSSTPEFCCICNRYWSTDYESNPCWHLWYCEETLGWTGPGASDVAVNGALQIAYVCESDDCYQCQREREYLSEHLEQWPCWHPTTDDLRREVAAPSTP